MLSDEILVECIRESGYYELENVNLDDLPKDKRIAVLLAGEVLALRPELKNSEFDVVYIRSDILENGEKVYGLPSKSLSQQLRSEPFSDSSIWTYSLKEAKLLKRIYQGTGTNWERVK